MGYSSQGRKESDMTEQLHFTDGRPALLASLNSQPSSVFLELFCFFDDPADVSILISGSSAFSQTSLNIWNFMVHILLKPG